MEAGQVQDSTPTLRVSLPSKKKKQKKKVKMDKVAEKESAAEKPKETTDMDGKSGQADKGGKEEEAASRKLRRSLKSITNKVKKFKKKGKGLNKNGGCKQCQSKCSSQSGDCECPDKSKKDSSKEGEGSSAKASDNVKDSKDQELDVGDNASNTSGSSVSSAKKKKNKQKKSFHHHPNYKDQPDCSRQRSDGSQATPLMDVDPMSWQPGPSNFGDGSNSNFSRRNEDRPQWVRHWQENQQWGVRGKRHNRGRGRGRFRRSSWNRWNRNDQDGDNYYDPTMNQDGGGFHCDERDPIQYQNFGNYHPRGRGLLGLYRGSRGGQHGQGGKWKAFGPIDIWGQGNEDWDRRNSDNWCRGDWHPEREGNPDQIDDNHSSQKQDGPRRERSVSLNLDDTQKSSDTDVPVPKKDNSNVSLKAMQIIDQIVNKKPAKVAGSRESQSSSVGSDPESSSKETTAKHVSNSTQKTTSKSVDNETRQGKDSLLGEYGFWDDRYREGPNRGSWRGRWQDGPPFGGRPQLYPYWREPGPFMHQNRSPSWQNREYRSFPSTESKGPGSSPRQEFKYSAPLIDSSDDEDPPPDCEEPVVKPKRLGSRSFSESHAEDVAKDLKNDDKQARQTKFKVSLPMGSKSVKAGQAKAGPLNKDYLTKLVNSPRSRKEQVQVAKMLKTVKGHIKQQRPTVQKPSLNTGGEKNVSIDELPDDIRKQISLLIDTDMTVSDEEVLTHSDEVIDLASHDEDEEEDDLDLIMLRDDSPPPGPTESKGVKDDGPAQKEAQLQKSKPKKKGKTSFGEIVIEDSDEEKEEGKDEKEKEEGKKKGKQSASAGKRRHNSSESCLPSQTPSEEADEVPCSKKAKLTTYTGVKEVVDVPKIVVISPERTNIEVMESSECVEQLPINITPSGEELSSKDEQHSRCSGSPAAIELHQDDVTPSSVSRGTNNRSPKPGCSTETIANQSPVSVCTENAESVNELLPSESSDALSNAISDGDCMNQMLTLSLREDEIHNKLTEVNKAVDKLQSLLKKTKEQLHRRLKQREKLIAEEENLRSQRISLLKGAVQRRSTDSAPPKDNDSGHLTPPKVAVSEISSSTEADNEMGGDQNEESVSRETPLTEPERLLQRTSETPSPSLQNVSNKLTDNSSITLPRSSDNNESVQPVNSSIPQVPIKEEVEPDSTSVIHLKEPKQEPEDDHIQPLQDNKSPEVDAPKDTQTPEDLLNKLRDNKGLKYLGSINARDTDLVMKSLASGSGEGSPRIYTLSSSDLNKNTQNVQKDKSSSKSKDQSSKPSAQSVAKVDLAQKEAEPFKFNFEVDSADVKTEKDDEQLLTEFLGKSITGKEVDASELASLGMTPLGTIKAEPAEVEVTVDTAPKVVTSPEVVPSPEEVSTPEVATSPEVAMSPKVVTSQAASSPKATEPEKKLTDETVETSVTPNEKKRSKKKPAKSLSLKKTPRRESPRRSPRKKPELNSKTTKTSKSKNLLPEIDSQDSSDLDSLDEAKSSPAKSPSPEPVASDASDLDFDDSSDPPPPKEYKGHGNTIHDIAVWSNFLITASEDHMILRFDINSCKVVKGYTGHSRGVQVIRLFHPGSGKSPVLYSGSYDNTVMTWDFETGEKLCTWTFTQRVHCMEIAWEKIYIGLGEGRIVCYSLMSGRLCDSFQCSKAATRSIKTSTEGSRRILVVASSDCSITIRDASSGLLLRSIENHAKVPMCLQVTNPFIYSGGADQNLLVHDLNTGEMMKCQVQKRVITSLVIHKGRIYIAGYEEVVRCLDMETLNLLYVIYGIKKGAITSLCVRNEKLFIGRKNGSLECVTLVKKANYICKFGQCLLPLTSVEDLIVHVNDYHIMPNQSVIRCLWKECPQYITKNKDALSHVTEHINAEYPKKSEEPLQEVETIS